MDNYWQEKNDWKKINGGCPVTPDVEDTLKNLSASVRPQHENLSAMIRASVEKRDVQGRPLEQIWAEKIAAGANFVGVLDGVFHFFKGEQILAEDNKPLRISALPAMFEFREKEKQAIHDRARSEMAALRANFQQSEFTNFVGGPVVPAETATENPIPYQPEGQITIGGGSEIA